MTALPRRNPAVADGGLPGTLHPGLRSQGLPCIPHRCFPKAHQELCPCSDLLPPPQRKGGTSSQESCSWSILESFLSLLSLDLRPIPSPCPPFFSVRFPGGRNRWAFLEKPLSAFSTSLLPPPLAFKNQALQLPWQLCRADLLLPAGHRYST